MMAVISLRNTSNPLLLPEIVGFVVDNVHMVPDLFELCLCEQHLERDSFKEALQGLLQ